MPRVKGYPLLSNRMPRKINIQAEYEKRVAEANRKHKATLEDAEKLLKDRLEKIEIWKKAEEAHELSRKKPEKGEKPEKKTPEPDSDSESSSEEEEEQHTQPPPVRVETPEEKRARQKKLLAACLSKWGEKGFEPTPELQELWNEVIEEAKRKEEEEKRKEEEAPHPNPPTYTYVPLSQFEKPPPILSDTKVRKQPKTVQPR